MTAEPPAPHRKPPVRSFMAIPLDTPARQAIAALQADLGEKLPGIRWTRAESLHLTLRFFGDLTEEMLDKAGAVMVSIERLFSPFSMHLTGVGAFPSIRRARVIWVGVESRQLEPLFNTLNDRLQEAGIARETRPFKAHITMGRSRRDPARASGALGPLATEPVANTQVREVVLYESELQPAGAIHRPRYTARLDRPE